jgi:hypothetical protein
MWGTALLDGTDQKLDDILRVFSVLTPYMKIDSVAWSSADESTFWSFLTPAEAEMLATLRPTSGGSVAANS